MPLTPTGGSGQLQRDRGRRGREVKGRLGCITVVTLGELTNSFGGFSRREMGFSPHKQLPLALRVAQDDALLVSLYLL